MVILLLLCLFLVTSLNCIDFYRDFSFVNAQCRALCIKTYPTITENKSKNECIASCSRNPEYCNSSCDQSSPHSKACLVGCHFVSYMFQKHSGTCPQRQNLRQIPCLVKCKVDSDCYSSSVKCCTVGCSKLCTNPIYNSSVPRLAPVLTPTYNSSELEFEWLSNYQHFIDRGEPLVFILQTRVCACKIFSPSYADDWQTLIITSQSGARLNAFDSGKLYQFRLAAVSRFGTRGYGPPSATFPKHIKRPKPPAPPRLVRESLTRVYSSGDISVTVTWQKPVEQDLPISEYTIKWTIDYGYVQPDGQALPSLIQFSHSIPQEKHSYIMENLKPNTSYRVELSSKVYWPGGKPLESEPISFFIKTPEIHKQGLSDVTHLQTEGCLNGSKIQKDGLDFAVISPAKYNSKNIQVTVTILAKHVTMPDSYFIKWTPRICIDMASDKISDDYKKVQVLQTKSRIFELKNLLYNCRYELTIATTNANINKDNKFIQSLSNKNSPSISTGQFCIPSCYKLRGSNCDKLDPITNPPPVPHSFTISPLYNDKRSYQLTWRQPTLPNTVPQRETFIIRYRIVWGPRINEPVRMKVYKEIPGFYPILDSSKATVKVLDKGQTQMLLQDLQPNTFYIVRAQLLVFFRDGQEIESEPVYHYFFTGKEMYSFEEDFVNNAAASSVNRNMEFTSIVTIFCSLLLQILLLWLTFIY